MEVEYIALENVTVIRVQGHLDHAAADALREAACTALLGRQRAVLLNLGSVQRVDAAGLGALAEVRRMATIVGAGLTLTNVRPRVRDMLDATALTDCFQIAASECDAIEDCDACARN